VHVGGLAGQTVEERADALLVSGRAEHDQPGVTDDVLDDAMHLIADRNRLLARVEDVVRVDVAVELHDVVAIGPLLPVPTLVVAPDRLALGEPLLGERDLEKVVEVRRQTGSHEVAAGHEKRRRVVAEAGPALAQETAEVLDAYGSVRE